MIALWDIATETLLGNLPFAEMDRTFVNALAFSPDGAMIAGAINDNTLRLWDLDSHRELIGKAA